MAPALGLYLDKLYFDGYNVKQQREMENDKRIAAMRAAEASTKQATEGEESNNNAIAVTKEGDDGDDDGDKDDPVSATNTSSETIFSLVLCVIRRPVEKKLIGMQFRK